MEDNDYKAMTSDRQSKNKETSEIRILNFNIFLRPYLVKTNKDDYKSERLTYIIAELANYDIACFQEAFDSITHRQISLLEGGKKMGLPYYARAPSPTFTEPSPVDGGMVILSRFPILKSDSIAFSDSISYSTLAAKGILYAKVDSPGGIIHVFTLHTQSSFEHPDLETERVSYYTRLKNIAEARNFIDEKMRESVSDEDTAFICGDFNVDCTFVNYPVEEVKKFFDIDFGLVGGLPNFTGNEYDFMHFILNFGQGGYSFIDVIYEQHGKFFATYGNTEIDENGVEVPLVD